ncbi:MAG: Mth938-like domain-containing protein [Pseudomonadota bacterium]
MRMNEIDFEAQPPIDGYGPGGFRIDGTWYTGGLLILPSGVDTVAEPLDTATIAPFLRDRDQIDLVLIGMGADIASVPNPVRTALEEAELGIEVMSTPSACRTYNVLLTEDRRVGAILLPV